MAYVFGGYTPILVFYRQRPAQGQFDYRFTTPYKTVLSASLILKKLGFITADYEYVNYGTMKYYYPDGYDENTNHSFQYEADLMNRSIRTLFKSASNLRIGAEIK